MSIKKENNVSMMGTWEEGRWGWSLKWRRELFDREKNILDQLLFLINRCYLVEGEQNSWRWKMTPDGICRTKNAYEVLISRLRMERGDPIPAWTSSWCGTYRYLLKRLQ